MFSLSLNSRSNYQNKSGIFDLLVQQVHTMFPLLCIASAVPKCYSTLIGILFGRASRKALDRRGMENETFSCPKGNLLLAVLFDMHNVE